MRIRGFLLGAVVFVVSCEGADVGPRYRAERDLWKADQKREKLADRPGPGNRGRWKALAGQYEKLGSRYLDEESNGPASVEVQRIAATAWLNAAEMHAALLDSVRSDQILQDLATKFEAVGSIAGEAALRQGRAAESRGEIPEAVERYRTAVDKIGLRPQDGDSTHSVLALPLRAAQLTAQSSDDPADPVHYEEARRLYESMLEDESERAQAAAMGFLADIAMDLGRWEEATEILDRLKRRLVEMEDPPRDPAEVQLASLTAQIQAQAPPDSLRARLESVLVEYPRSSVGAKALYAMANGAAAQGQLEAAIGYLDWIRRDYEAAGIVPDAVLTRGLLLERSGRWTEALTEFRTLLIEFPTTPAALRAPLEITAHYWRVGDEAGAREALARAEKEYREVLARYPAGPHTVPARERLIRTLTLQARHGEALAELLALSEEVAGTERELTLLIEGARMARVDLEDTSRAIAILERAAKRFPGTRIGAWSAKEAERLGGETAP